MSSAKYAQQIQSPIIHPLRPRGNFTTLTGVVGKAKALHRRELSRAFIARFHTKYTKTDGCWLWQAGAFKRGYGMVNLGRDAQGRQFTTYAHRVAYVIAHVEIPDGAVVMHSCDTPGCVNPDHLSLGTQSDNLQDASKKGRLPKTRVAGRKLTDAQVLEVLQSSEKNVRLAERLGVNKTTISLIRRGLRRKAA